MKTEQIKIVLIDDDPFFCNLILRMLGESYEITVAHDGASGFDQVMQQAPEIAIIDINMPVQDGITTLKKLREEPSLESLKVIMLTADGSPFAVREAIRAGANDYIIKPMLSKETLIEKLNQLLPEDSVLLNR